MPDICLFPLPNHVTFPGTVFPLHVFEPRYRKMMNYCLENKLQIAICHTRKVIRPANKNQTMEQALKSNQATYKPFEIFSAGECELIDITDDGRMYLNIHIKNRYRSLREKQTLPFLIHECEIFADRQETNEELNQAQELQQTLLKQLLKLTQENPSLQAHLASESWQQKPLKAFSLELFSLVSFDPDVQQEILSTNSIIERLQLASNLIHRMSE